MSQHPAETTQSQPASSPVGAIPQVGPDSAVCAWLTTQDGVMHFVRFWPAGNSGAAAASPIAVYFHGIEGHSRWFENTALQLNKSGISVYAADRRGAGASREARGHLSKHERLLSDMDELLSEISQRHPRSSLFVIANCWGGKAAAALAADQTSQKYKGKLAPNRISGLILTSPAVDTQVDVSFWTKVQIGIDYLMGGKKCFDIPLGPEHFTDNPPYLQYIKDDPLRLKQATSAFFVESLKLTGLCRKAASRLNLPVLVLQSGRDAIVRASGLEAWFESISSKDKTLKTFTSAAHSLDFEPDASEYQQLLVGWILDRAPEGVLQDGCK